MDCTKKTLWLTLLLITGMQPIGLLTPKFRLEKARKMFLGNILPIL